MVKCPECKYEDKELLCRACFTGIEIKEHKPVLPDDARKKIIDFIVESDNGNRTYINLVVLKSIFKDIRTESEVREDERQRMITEYPCPAVCRENVRIRQEERERIIEQIKPLVFQEDGCGVDCVTWKHIKEIILDDEFSEQGEVKE